MEAEKHLLSVDVEDGAAKDTSAPQLPAPRRSGLARRALVIAGSAMLLGVGVCAGVATSSPSSSSARKQPASGGGSSSDGVVSLFSLSRGSLAGLLPWNHQQPKQAPLQPLPGSPLYHGPYPGGAQPVQPGMGAGAAVAGAPIPAPPPPPPAEAVQEDGPQEMNFYMYRAGGPAYYPMENVNTGSLEGVMWYVHNEVVTSAPRKYGIDRIRRFQVRVHNTQEFWNVHKTQFGPFMAFDAGRCTTVNQGGQDICDQMYRQYGFIVGCQAVASGVAAYYHRQPSTTACDPGTMDCYKGLWYSLPGECPSQGIPQLQIDANLDDQDVDLYKTADCRMRMPGGLCDAATGTPDCTYSIFPAGEVYLNELSGIDNYDAWWNTSFEICMGQYARGERLEPCEKNIEFNAEMDAGIGTDFWDGRLDPVNCSNRMDAVRRLFADKFPGLPATVDEPVCDFDAFYQDEFAWPINHDGAAESEWWNYRNAGPVPTPVQYEFNTPAPVAEIQYAPGVPIPTPAPATYAPPQYGEEGYDPYATATDAYATTLDPYAAATDPYAASADPYAAATDPYAAATDPYAAATDPYAAPADPYAAATDPYAAAAYPAAPQQPDAYGAAPPPADTAASAYGEVYPAPAPAAVPAPVPGYDYR